VTLIAVYSSGDGARFWSSHFNGRNFETKQRLDDEVAISKDVLSGKMKANPIQGP
jgi:hypothetical protein